MEAIGTSCYFAECLVLANNGLPGHVAGTSALLPGTDIPASIPCTSMVSPSITEAVPGKSARAGVASR